MNPSVVCITVNWNGWRDTLACLDSLQNTEYPNLQVIVVDNGSTDDSVAQIHAAHPHVHLLETGRNLGFAGGNNAGIRAALEQNANYLWLLNNDTIVQPSTLPALVAAAEADPHVGQVGGVLSYYDDPARVQAWGGGEISLWSGISRHHHAPVAAHRLHYITAASVLIPATVLTRIGLLDEGYFMYWEDADLSFRIRRAGYTLVVAPQATLLHKENASTGRNTPRMERYVTASAIRFLRKHAPVPVIPIFIYVFARAARRFLSGQWARGAAILAGLRGRPTPPAQ